MSTALASIQEKIKAELAIARTTVAAPSAKTISVKGKTFTLPTGVSSQGPITSIILDYRNFNKYYTALYNPQKPSAPDCFAIHSVIEEMAPHEKARKPSHPNCRECTFNKFGSATGGGKGKACRNTVRLAVIPSDFMSTTKEDTEPMLLNISPTGLTGWSMYVNGLLVNEMLPVQIVTEISFDANAAYPKLIFKGLKQNEHVEIAWMIREKAQAMLDAAPATDGE